MEPALAPLAADPVRLAALVELALALDDADGLAEVATAAARGLSRVLGGRGVLVQLDDSSATTGNVSAAAGPEMSAELFTTPLAGSAADLGEVVLDGRRPLGDDAPAFDALLARVARAADRITVAALELRDREALLQAASALLQRRAARPAGRADRLRDVVRVLAGALDLDAADVGRLVEVAPWVDLVELAVPDGLLVRPDDGAEDGADEDVLRAAHAERGADAAAFALRGGGPLAALAVDVLGAARERWDGHGGPAGLSGDEIPLGARVVAVADRLEREATRAGVSAALEAARRLAGTRLDPGLVELAVAHRAALERLFESLREDRPAARPSRIVA